MALEQYIVRELRQDIKYLIQKVDCLEQKLEEAHPTQKTPDPADVIREIEKEKPEPDPSSPEGTFKRYAGYTEWNKTHDNYKTLYALNGQDEHGKKIK
jgi:hypothetical protein|tara:strand:+ start:1244 stop:1537 length:294 start_codon:yes stop_codon:yes gene_type:complete